MREGFNPKKVVAKTRKTGIIEVFSVGGIQMNKEELVKEISKKAKVSQKEASEVLSTIIDTITKNVAKGKKVTLVGFGTFESRKRAARTGRNPQTGKEIKIPAKTVPAFSAGKKFKETVGK